MNVRPHIPTRSNPELFSQDLEGEEWKEIQGYEGRFEISTHGRVRTIARFVKRIKSPHFKPSFLKSQRMNKFGYITVYLSKNKVYKHFFAHRLVAEAFVSKRPSKSHFVNHKDGIKSNNHYSNLEWVTSSENLKHAFRMGLMCQKGESHASNKLNDNQVLMVFSSTESSTILAKRYKVCSSTICNIRNGTTWSHLTGKLKNNDIKSRAL